MTEEAKLMLREDELTNIMVNTNKVKLIEKDKSIIELKKQLLSVQDALLNAQKEVVKRDHMILEYHEIKVNQELSDAKDKSRNDLHEISKHHEGLIGKKWGYNPETGEIIINEEPETIPE